MKKVILGVFIFAFFLSAGIADFCLAQENTVEVNFFYSPTCPHCAEEEKFLDNLQEDYPDLRINRYSVLRSENLQKLKGFYKKFNVPEQYYGMVPATFTNSKYFIGFNNQVGRDIRNCLSEICYKNNVSEESSTIVDIKGNIEVPFIGKINIRKYSFPVLAVILGILDGFNVCSLGALVLILGLVLALKSRKKTLIFGGVFILTTAVIYGILIVAWYNIFTLFLPYMKIMQVLIGLLGLGGGAYFLKQFLKFKRQGPICEMSAGKSLMAKFSSKFQKALQESRNIILILGSVFLFAIIVTIVEFPCSAVIPVAFAGVLAQANLSAFNYLLYISIFVLFYMMDEIIVFLVAFFTMKIWLASSKAVTWITLAEALILFGLGIYYLYSVLL